MVFLEIKGKETPADVLKEYSLAIKSNHWEVTRFELQPNGGSRSNFRMTQFKLFPSADPKMIDLWIITPEGITYLSQGIYKLEGDTLTICRTAAQSEKRPKKFASTQNSGVLVIWQRAAAPQEMNQPNAGSI